MIESQRIQRVSRVMQRLCVFLVGVLPLIVVLTWFVFDDLLLAATQHLGIPLNPENFTFTIRLLACSVSLIPVAMICYCLWQLGHLFTLYQADKIFGQENTQALLNFARMLLIYAIAKPITTTLLVLIVTFNNPPGERLLVITLSSNDLAVFFISAGCHEI